MFLMRVSLKTIKQLQIQAEAKMSQTVLDHSVEDTVKKIGCYLQEM